MYDGGSLSGYDWGGDDGMAFGQMASMETLKGVAVKTAVAAGTAGLLAALEGYQKDGLGAEIKIGGKVPLTLTIAAIAHVAGAFGAGEAIGVSDDYLHAIGTGALATFAVNRGHSWGQNMGKAACKSKNGGKDCVAPADKTPLKGSGGGVPRRQFGVPAYQSQGMYPQFQNAG
jgi:hypothetical protein